MKHKKLLLNKKEINKFLDLYNLLPTTVHNKKQNVIKKRWLKEYGKELEELFYNKLKNEIGDFKYDNLKTDSGDVIYGEAVRQKKDYEREEARRLVEEEMRQRGLDQSYIDSIIASMTAYGYTQAEIDEILAMQGYARGGRVGYAGGGGIVDIFANTSFTKPNLNDKLSKSYILDPNNQPKDFKSNLRR